MSRSVVIARGAFGRFYFAGNRRSLQGSTPGCGAWRGCARRIHVPTNCRGHSCLDGLIGQEGVQTRHASLLSVAAGFGREEGCARLKSEVTRPRLADLPQHLHRLGSPAPILMVHAANERQFRFVFAPALPRGASDPLISVTVLVMPLERPHLL